MYLCTSEDFLNKSAYISIGGQVIGSVKCADGLVLLAREETVLQGVVDRLSEIGSDMEWK
jgi:hypothetical protein